jgi:hypothetical protein
LNRSASGGDDAVTPGSWFWCRRDRCLLPAGPPHRPSGCWDCYDHYVCEEQVAASKEFSGSAVSDLNHGPKHQIGTKKLRSLGMTFSRIGSSVFADWFSRVPAWNLQPPLVKGIMTAV